MTKIADQIAMLSSQFFLHSKPIVSSISVAINSVAIPNDATNGWTYDATANSIQFHGTAVPQQGDSIDVHFDPESLTF